MQHLVCMVLMVLYAHKLQGVVLISFGSDCTAAMMLRELGLRRAAYPFDWIFSDFISLYQALDEDFQNFLKPDALRVSDDERMIIDYYGLKFVHDFPTIHHGAALYDNQNHDWATIRVDWREFITPIRGKYQKRIERLRDVLKGSDRVVIVRHSLTKDEARKLRDLLISRYPTLDFSLVAVNNSKVMAQDWDLNRVSNFCVVYGNPNMVYDWKKIFDTLGVDPREVRYQGEDDAWVCDGSCHHLLNKP